MSKIIYSGYFLTDEAKAEVLKRFDYEHEIHLLHHCTIEYSSNRVPWLHESRPAELEIVGSVRDIRGQVLLVNSVKTTVTSGLPHITMSVEPNTKPAYSKDLLNRVKLKDYSKGSYRLELCKPFTITAIEGYMYDRNVEREESLVHGISNMFGRNTSQQIKTYYSQFKLNNPHDR